MMLHEKTFVLASCLLPIWKTIFVLLDQILGKFCSETTCFKIRFLAFAQEKWTVCLLFIPFQTISFECCEIFSIMGFQNTKLNYIFIYLLTKILISISFYYYSMISTYIYLFHSKELLLSVT